MVQELALLGIDGVGKSTIAAALMSRLRSEGRNIDITSWSTSARKQPSEFARGCLSDVLFAAFRSMYAGARNKDGPVNVHFPASAQEFFTSESARGFFLDLELVENEAWGVLAGAFGEMTGNVLFRYLDVVPRIKAGRLVIQETFGYKHLVKDLYLAKTLAIRNGNPGFVPLIEKLEEVNESMFATILAPEMGFVIDGDPVPAIKRRMNQEGRAGWTESMQLSCDCSTESFLHMQRYTRDKFLAYAKRYNWPVITIDDEGKEKNVSRAVEILAEAFRSPRDHDHVGEEKGLERLV